MQAPILADLPPTVVITTEKMAVAIAIGRRAAVTRQPNVRCAFQAAAPLMPIVRRPGPRVRRPFAAAIQAMRAIWTVTATAWAANNRPMTDEEHLWGCAVAIEKLYGAGAPRHVAERIGALVLAGDLAGVARWQSIAACLLQLQRAPTGS